MSKTKTIIGSVLIALFVGLFFVGVGGCSKGVDTSGDYIDLTNLSSTMVDAQVTEMFNHPDDYRGKTVKISGTCNIYRDNKTQKTYYSAIINASCCPKGLEFVLKEGTYPQQGRRITVEGKFSSYKENSATYFYLRQAKLI